MFSRWPWKIVCQDVLFCIDSMMAATWTCSWRQASASITTPLRSLATRNHRKPSKGQRYEHTAAIYNGICIAWARSYLRASDGFILYVYFPSRRVLRYAQNFLTFLFVFCSKNDNIFFRIWYKKTACKSLHEWLSLNLLFICCPVAVFIAGKTLT